MNDVRDIIIIGGGPAGYTAALYAARANLNPLAIEGFGAGGQLMITSDVENFPGFPEGIMGPELMARFRAQAERFGTEFLTDDVTRVDFSERPFKVYVGDEEHRAHAVIVATGATARQLGLPSEQSLQGRGVSYCAVCDGAFFKQQRVIVVGGGDSALEEASFLSKFASEVVVVHRRSEFRASKIMQDYARAKDNVSFLTPYAVDEVLGQNGAMTGVKLRNLSSGEERVEEAQGLFVAIGHDPNTSLFLDWLDHDVAGYLVVENGSTRSNIDGVFVAGDVADHIYRQAVTAAGSGCAAALDAERFLAHGRGADGAATSSSVGHAAA
jgi:thioredoxin reductase (NADPH)